MLTCHMFPRVTVGSPQQFVKKKNFFKPQTHFVTHQK